MIWAVVNQKGGVGKTTTAVNLSAALGALERRVLLVDNDPQGNATRGLGLEGERPHLYDVLLGDCSLAEVIQASGFPGLDVAPSGRDLVGIEVELVGQADWQQRLRQALEALEGYDDVLIDCPPSLGHLTLNALVAADRAIVPLQCEYLALEGLRELLATVTRVRSTWNPRLSIEGILLTMFDDRTRLARDVKAEALRHFPQHVFGTVVPRNVRLAEAPSFGIPVLEHDIRSRGAQAYLEVARELMRRKEAA